MATHKCVPGAPKTVASLRSLAAEDVPAIVAACMDYAELAPFGPPFWRPRSQAELLRKIAGAAGPQLALDYSFVVENASGVMVGECSTHTIDWRNGFAQIGVCIWDPVNRRKGYGRVAVNHVIDWAFDYLGLCRLEAWIVDGNEPSVALFTSLGFIYEATLEGRYLHAGVRHAMHVLAMRPPDRP